MANKRRLLILPAAIAMIVAFSGCAEDPFALVPVSGVVKIDGKPLDGGIISFQPSAKVGDNSGPGSSGVCDAEGRFTLKTQALDAKPGAVVGVHKIRITKTNRSADAPPPDSSSDEDAEPVFEGVPMKYNLKSTLKFTVPEGGTEEANFDLAK